MQVFRYSEGMRSGSSSFQGAIGDFLVLNGDWSKMTWKEYLDRADVIAVEAAEPLINAYSFGFVDELIKALDSYVPEETGGDR